MTVHVFLSPPQALSANETSRGVLLRWEPPAQLSVALSGYALELRQDKGGWEVLERSIPGTESQVLVPGLIKVRCCVAGEGLGVSAGTQGGGGEADGAVLDPPRTPSMSSAWWPSRAATSATPATR